jgi:hypothetical protein
MPPRRCKRAPTFSVAASPGVTPRERTRPVKQTRSYFDSEGIVTYVVYGIASSAITAITEKVLINGYLLVRLEQLGWQPRRALVLSLALRSNYHIYYGIGVFLTIPFGYYVTRSFQKHRRLNRPIAAHFLYDAVLTTIAVLSA